MATDIPWPDWPNEHIEEARYVKDKKWMLGYEDGTFKPWDKITERQVVAVCQRAGIRTDLDPNDFSNIPSKMGWVETNFLPGTVYQAGPDEDCTRFRFVIMLYRSGGKPGPTTPVVPTSPSKDESVTDILEKWFSETKVTWQGTTRKPRLIGHAQKLVECSRKYNIPLGIALGQCWRESQWGTTGLSIEHNCLWGVKDPNPQFGASTGTVRGYTDYVDIDTNIEAYFKFMRDPNRKYGGLIDKFMSTGDWAYLWEALDIYAPAFENDTSQHHAIVKKVMSWCKERGIE